MVDTVPRPDANLAEFLAASARHASDDRLAADALGGLLAVSLAGIWRGPGWYVFLAMGTCFFAFGVWGIVDRELLEGAVTRRAAVVALRTLRILAASAGFAAGLFLMLVALAKALGRIIS